MKNNIYIYLISILTTFLFLPFNVLGKEEVKLASLITSWSTNKTTDVFEDILCKLEKMSSSRPTSNVSVYGMKILNLNEPDKGKADFYRNHRRILEALSPFIRKNPENYCDFFDFLFDYFKRLNGQVLPWEKVKKPILYSGFPKKIFTSEEELAIS